MKYTLNKKVEKPFLHSKNNIIIKVNNEFTKFTGYSKDELIGKLLTEISCILRIKSNIYINNIEKDYECYVFTKSLEAREVTISCKSLECIDEKIYFFNEKPNSRIEDKCMFLEHVYANKKIGFAIHSVPDLILLKANKTCLDFLDAPYNRKENSIGKFQKEIVTGFEGSKEEEIFLDVIKTGKAYNLMENKYENFKTGTGYWNWSVIPIFVDGEVKYIIDTAEEVTERVLNRNLIEEQAKIIELQKDQQLEAIIENISDGLFTLDKNYNYSLLKSSSVDFFYNSHLMKKSQDSLVHTKYYDLRDNLIAAEDLPNRRVLRGEKIKEYRVTCDRPDGIYHFDMSGSPVYDENGEVEKAIMCYRNVTEKVNNENFIRMQKEQLEAIIEGMSDALLIFDKAGNYTTFNKAAREAFFIEATKLNKIGDGLKECKYFDRNKKMISSDNTPGHRVLRGEKLLGYRMGIKTNENVVYHDINGTPIYDNEGTFMAGIICCRDVTEKVKYEEDLLIKTQYTFLNKMVDNLDLPVLRLSYSDSIVTHINQKSYNVFKKLQPKIKSISCIIGQKYEDITNFDKKEVVKHIVHVIRNKESSYLKNQRLVVAGEEMFMNLLYQPVFGIDGEVSEIVAIIIDVTQEVRANNHMEKTLKTHEEFFANISHELKTPLNVIFSTAQLFNLYLKNDCITDQREKIDKYTNIMVQNCYRLSKLINNLVDLSKIQSGFFELNISNENIVNVIEDVVESVSEYVKSKGLNITFDTDVEENIIACDVNKIQRVILNLISNSIKFSELGDEIYVSVDNKDDTVEISVVDSGMGIDERYLDSIFERFKQVDKSFTRNTEGSGIGLCLVKSIVELHGGKISVESKLGKGSKFKIELPSRTIEKTDNTNKDEMLSNNVDRINIEFSDIYY